MSHRPENFKPAAFKRWVNAELSAAFELVESGDKLEALSILRSVVRALERRGKR